MYFDHIIAYVLSVVKCSIATIMSIFIVSLVLTRAVIYAINVSNMSNKILNDLVAVSQTRSQISGRTEGLRVLARIIACDLLVRRLATNSKEHSGKARKAH